MVGGDRSTLVNVAAWRGLGGGGKGISLAFVPAGVLVLREIRGCSAGHYIKVSFAQDR